MSVMAISGTQFAWRTSIHQRQRHTTVTSPSAFSAVHVQRIVIRFCVLCIHVHAYVHVYPTMSCICTDRCMLCVHFLMYVYGTSSCDDGHTQEANTTTVLSVSCLSTSCSAAVPAVSSPVWRPEPFSPRLRVRLYEMVQSLRPRRGWSGG